MVLDARQALVIDLALHQFEALKPIVVKQKAEIRELRGANLALHAGLSAADSALVFRTQQAGIQRTLRQSAEADTQRWRGKARSRFWTIVGETALLLGITALAIGR